MKEETQMTSQSFDLTSIMPKLTRNETSGASSAKNDTMLVYQISVLDIRVKSLIPIIETQNDTRKTAIFDEVKARLPDIASIEDPNHVDAPWTELYRLERMLALIEPVESLPGEAQRRIDEAKDENVSTADRLQTRLSDALKLSFDFSKNPPERTAQCEILLRPLLLETLEDIHWTFQNKYTMRPIQRSASDRIIVAALMTFVTMIIPYILIYYKIYRTGPIISFLQWSWLPLYSALTAGLFGAFFSRLQSLQSRWNTLSLGQARDARDWRSIMLRGVVGMGGALVVYFFLQSGLVKGQVFPNFEKIAIAQSSFWPNGDAIPSPDVVGWMRLVQPNLDLSLLIIWSFIAGFSERLVPGILATTETSISTAASGQRG
jgi:hypothetical protein